MKNLAREAGGNVSEESYLTCGEFAALCEVKKQTLFHYDDIGLLKPEIVNDKGYRFYSYGDACLLYPSRSDNDSRRSLPPS